MGFFDLFEEPEQNKDKQRQVRKEGQDTEFANEAHLDLREEELDIHKHRVETGDVELHKEIVEEEKEVNVPVSHDQVILNKEQLTMNQLKNLFLQKRRCIYL
ncbi:DUF2382 domain-containing protein [Alkalihalophilus pseudofirmus]|nr:DUF2382 domain-containing protein [Alkalihalophilus pseudofirmus]WEG15162.1 DUF2382 domain-containing protein [Alkalihalophilus pseudofirmus]